MKTRSMPRSSMKARAGVVTLTPPATITRSTRAAGTESSISPLMVVRRRPFSSSRRLPGWVR